MYYNLNECKRNRENFEYQATNNQFLYCYPEGWSCDIYKDRDEKYDCFYKNENKQEYLEKDFYGCCKQFNGLKQENYSEKEQYFNYEREKNNYSCNREENVKHTNRRCCFCNLFNCFCKRN